MFFHHSTQTHRVSRKKQQQQKQQQRSIEWLTTAMKNRNRSRPEHDNDSSIDDK